MSADDGEVAEREQPDGSELVHFRYIVEETGEIDEFSLTRAEIDEMYPGGLGTWVERPEDVGVDEEADWEIRTTDEILAEWAAQDNDDEEDSQ